LGGVRSKSERLLIDCGTPSQSCRAFTINVQRFAGINDFQRSLDVAGSLWSWDGWATAFRLYAHSMEIPDHLILTPKSLPVRWKSRIAVSRAFGDAWLKTNNLPALRVPTVITPGEWNVLVNPLHPQFSLKWVVTGPDAYTFDARLLPVKKGIRSRRTPRDQ
jgi:hypothetical protein